MEGAFENEEISEDDGKELSELERRRLLLCGKYDVIKAAVSRLTVQRDDVEDLSQDIFLIAYSHIGQLKQTGSMDCWLYKITRRYVGRYLKNCRQKEKRELSWDEETGWLSVRNRSSGDWERMCAQIEHGDLMSFLEKLDAVEQTIVKMRYLKGFSLVEIAKLLHMNYNTVKTIKSRALKKLREMLKNDEMRVAKRE